MYLLGARWYDPTINRFVSVDPHPGNQDDPITLNEYAYCRNNPINNTDPDGEFPFNQVALAGVGAGGGTIGIFGSTGAGALLVAAAPYLLAIAAGVVIGCIAVKATPKIVQLAKGKNKTGGQARVRAKNEQEKLSKKFRGKDKHMSEGRKNPNPKKSQPRNTFRGR